MIPKHLAKTILSFAIGGLLLCGFVGLADADVDIDFLRTPDNGIQPRAAVDAEGTIHLVYYKKADKNGDLFYVTRQLESSSWAERVRVNSEAGNVVPNGSIGMASLAIGKNGRVYVSWFDMRGAKYWYARMNDERSAFETQRNLVTRFNKGIEASGALAADGVGNVYMFWHAGSFSNESKRRIYLTHSGDEGKTFSEERRANPEETGSCACCGLSAIVDREGTLYVSYRAAGENVHRDMTLLMSRDFAQTFSTDMISDWELGACPVTTTAFVQRPESGALVAWETKGRSFLAHVDTLSDASSVGPPPSSGRQKNPSIAVNDAGQTLIVWGEGEGWSSGGKLHWQVFDSDGTASDQRGSGKREIPAHSVAAAVALLDGQFVIVY